ncbi:DUF899 family protein [Phytomonospora sp. NPDC050363]|uniref:DUF899 family protein n=1 Tax=Phytomonospora sp. NPDC050363 TaxID=3155642 RepID=UPI0033F542EF
MTTTPVPRVVDRETWSRERAALLSREKAHTREGDAIAAARRRLPMTEVDAGIGFTGADGPVTLLDLFEGREQLFVFGHMWHHGGSFADQCRGCTANVWNFQDASYLNARGVTFAVVCEGAYAEIAPFREFMGYPVPWYSSAGAEAAGFPADAFAFFLRRGERVFLTYGTDHRGCEVMMPALLLLDMTVYGRQETWEDSPEGWPQDPAQSWFRRDGRPLPQWTRPGVTAVE